jgi:hypothetical protein
MALKSTINSNLVFKVLNVSWYPGEGANTQRNGRGGYAANRLTGTYRLDQARSDNPATVADRVTRGLPGGEQQRRRNMILRRLEAPEWLAIERRGRTVTIASSRAPAIVGGGKGAAIGAAVGAGTGAGSVFVQGREDLDLMSGTEFMIRASPPR